MICRLCHSPQCREFGVFWKRRLWQCQACSLIYVPDTELVSHEAERQRYDRHTNRHSDPGYVRYLATVAAELTHIPCPAPRVLDFGSGPDYVLTQLLRERGLDCVPYDPLYNLPLPPDPLPFDVVIACEVLEHLRDLPKELALIHRLLRSGGYLLARTELYDAIADWGQWHYANDETHINFFHSRTMNKVADLLHAGIVYADRARVTILVRQD